MAGLDELPSYDEDSLGPTRQDRISYAGELWRIPARLINKLRQYVFKLAWQVGLADGSTPGTIQYYLNRILQGTVAPTRVDGVLVASKGDGWQGWYLGPFAPNRYTAPAIRLRASVNYDDGLPTTRVHLVLLDLGPTNDRYDEPVTRGTIVLPQGAALDTTVVEMALSVSVTAGVNAGQILPDEHEYMLQPRSIQDAEEISLGIASVWLDVQGSLLGGAAGPFMPSDAGSDTIQITTDEAGTRIELKNADTLAPSKVYGTNGAGVLGFYTPSGGGGSSGVRAVTFVVGNATSGAGTDGCDFIDPGDGSGVKAACDAVRALELVEGARALIVVRNGTYVIPAGGYWRANGNTDVVAESDKGVIFVSPADGETADFRAIILDNHATMRGCSVVFTGILADDVVEPESYDSLVTIHLGNHSRVTGGTWTVALSGDEFCGLAGRMGTFETPSEGIQIIDVDLDMTFGQVPLMSFISFALFYSPFAPRIPYVGTTPCVFRGGHWRGAIDGLGYISVGDIYGGFDVYDVTLEGPWSIRSAPSTVRAPYGEDLPTYHGPIYDGIRVLDAEGRLRAYQAFYAEAASYWDAPTMRNIECRGDGIQCDIVALAADVDAPATCTVRGLTLEHITSLDPVHNNDNYVAVAAEGPRIVFTDIAVDHVSLASTDEEAWCAITFGGYNGPTDFADPRTVYTSARVVDSSAMRLYVGRDASVVATNFTMDGSSYFPFVMFGQGEGGEVDTVETPVTLGEAVRYAEMNANFTAYGSLGSAWLSRAPRVFMVDSIDDKGTVDRNTPDMIGVLLLAAGGYGASKGFLEGDVISLWDDISIGGVRSWICTNAGGCAWRPHDYEFAALRETGLNVYPETNVTAASSNSIFFEREQGSSVCTIRGSASIIPTAPGRGWISIPLNPVDFPDLLPFASNYLVTGVAVCSDTDTDTIVPGIVTSVASSNGISIAFVFTSYGTAHDVSFTAVFDAAYVEPP